MALGLFTLLCVALGSIALQRDAPLDPSHQTNPSVLVTESSLLPSFSATSNRFTDTQETSTASPSDSLVITSEHIAEDCTTWINPTDDSEYPSAITKLPAVISVSNLALNESFSLAIVDKYGEQLTCFKAHAQYPESHVSLFIGKCDETEPIFQGFWPDLSRSQSGYWPCLVKPVLSVSDYFHIEVSAKEAGCNNESLIVSFSPNSDLEKAISVTVSSSAEFIYIFATRIKTGVNMVYFQSGYTASKCQTLDEPVKWSEAAYFLPDSGTKEVKIYISYCHFTEVLSYSVNPQRHQWRKLSFSENPLIESQEHIFFYRNILVDDKIIGNITTTTNYPPLLLRLMRVCPLKEAKVSMTNAIWTNKCEMSDMTNESQTSNGTYDLTSLKPNESVTCENLSSNASETIQSIPLSLVDPDAAAQDCSYWISPEEPSDSPSAFTKIPSVISISGISVNDSFRVAITDKYRNHLVCFEATAKDQETHVSIFSGKCHHRDPISEEIWSQMIQPKDDHWTCLVKPHIPLSNYFHIEIRKENARDGTQQTAISFRPNGKSEKTLSANVHTSAEFIYIFGNKIKIGVNLVNYLNGYMASKCQTLDEPVGWNRPAYFLPFEGETLVKIYISYCHFTEVISYSANPDKPRWHELSFREDESIREMDNIFFHRYVLIDGSTVGNLTTTVEQPPPLLRLMKFCPLKEAKISMTNAIWMHKCSPESVV
ncbi:uncharacterized protein LOC135201670 [Macrobrachium nipponense]|uniref:uncharacterized protein LOC135201670 n=1 Tax=Macrobrachium nipponense TaxID=159736 RepID=UPI0030C8477F